MLTQLHIVSPSPERLRSSEELPSPTDRVIDDIPFKFFFFQTDIDSRLVYKNFEVLNQ